MMTIPLDSFAAALVFAGAYLAGGWFGSSAAVERLWSRRRFISAAAGYPSHTSSSMSCRSSNFSAGVIVETAAGADLMFAEQRIYLLALLSFVVFYGLEHIVLVHRGGNRDSTARHERDTIYWVHLAGYAAYSALIGYLLVERAERGVLALCVCTFAMAVHFFIVDHALEEAHGSRYEEGGRGLLAASVVAGWLIGAAMPLAEARGGAAVCGARGWRGHHQPACRAAR